MLVQNPKFNLLQEYQINYELKIMCWKTTKIRQRERSKETIGKEEKETLKPVVEKRSTKSVTEKDSEKFRKSSTGRERIKLKLNHVDDSNLTDDTKIVLKHSNKMSGSDEYFEPTTVKGRNAISSKKFGVNCNFLYPQGQRGFKVCFQFEKYGSCKFGSTCKFSHRPFQKARRDYGTKQLNTSNGARQTTQSCK